MVDKKILQFNNFKLDFSKIKSDINLKEITDKELRKALKIFDTDGNGIIDTKNTSGNNEITNIWEKLSSAAKRDSNMQELSLSELSEMLEKSNTKGDVKSLAESLIIAFKQDRFTDSRRAYPLGRESIKTLENLPLEKQLEATKLLYLENRHKEEQLDFLDIIQIIDLPKKEKEKAFEIVNIKGRENDPLYFDEDLQELVKLPNNKFKIAKNLMYVPERSASGQLYFSEIIDLANLPEKNFQKANYLIHNTKISGIGATQLSKLDDDHFNLLKELEANKELSIPEMDYSDLKFVEKKDFEKFKRIISTKDSKDKMRFNITDASILAKLSEKELKEAEQLYKYEDLPSNIISDLIKDVSAKDVEYLINLPGRKDKFYIEELTAIARVYNDEVKKIIAENPNFVIDDASVNYNRPIIEIKKDTNANESYVFDPNGLIETTTSQKGPDIAGFNDTKIIKIKNLKNNIEQTSLVGKSKNPNYDEILISDEVKYFDKDGKLLKTMTTKENHQKGTMNASIKYPNGKVEPIQFMSIDPQSGAEITERNFTSPDGTKTKYYYEETDDLKIKNYKITDKNGKVLMDVNQTFQKLSENKLISTINGHSYQIEYKENSIDILDKKTNKLTTINTTELLPSNPSDRKVTLDALKQLPANQLLMLNKLPIFRIIYNDKNHMNGSWDSITKELTLGNYDSTFDPKDAMLTMVSHEYGHFLDLHSATADEDRKGDISSDKKLLEITEEEKKAFYKNSTYAQQKHILYFTERQQTGGKNVHSEEGVAEANAMLYSNSSSQLNTRRFYYQMFFPERIARTLDLIHKKQGIE